MAFCMICWEAKARAIPIIPMDVSTTFNVTSNSSTNMLFNIRVPEIMTTILVNSLDLSGPRFGLRNRMSIMYAMLQMMSMAANQSKASMITPMPWKGLE